MNRLEAYQAIRNLSQVEFLEKLRPQNLSKDRESLLFDIVQGTFKVRFDFEIDLKEYVIKTFFPEEYKTLGNPSNPYAPTQFYEYDLAKNGQNIIKHGLGFGEVVSYSNNFGTLMIPLIPKLDEKRLVIFSELNLRSNINKLELPPVGVKNVNYVMSIVESTDDIKFRFISSRLLSSKRKKCEQTIAQAVRDLFDDDQERSIFISRSMEILELYLFSPPLQLKAD